jgi:hypothetical protein
MDHCTRSIRARIVYRMPLYSTAWSLDTNQKLSKTARRAAPDRGEYRQAAGATRQVTVTDVLCLWSAVAIRQAAEF